MEKNLIVQHTAGDGRKSPLLARGGVKGAAGSQIRSSRSSARVTQSTANARRANGRYSVRGAFIAFSGWSAWSIDDFEKIERFYQRRFGHPPPVSAMGQSETHERLGLDHSDAVDIALRPESPEGRALMAYLRAAGIPFIAFRGRFRGVSTGAHIHIGHPSPRLLEVRQRVVPAGGNDAGPG